MKNRGAFTLIELLSVVAIIAILLAILIPVIGKLRSSANSAKCISNLRQTGQAALLYFTANDGNFFPSKYWEIYPSWNPGSKSGMRDYLGVKSNLVSISGVDEFYRDTIITCPTLSDLNPDISMALHRTYSFNYYLNKKDPSSQYNSQPSADRPDLASGYGKLINVEKPSAMWMFTDGFVSGGGSYYGSYLNNSATAIKLLLFPHEDRQHIVFADGHVEGLNEEQFFERAEDRFFWGRVE